MVALPFCHIRLKILKPLHLSYPKRLVTLGDHIKQNRLNLKATQRGVAKILGASKNNVYNWKNNLASPSLRLMPKIIRFLGYVPLKRPSDPDDPIEMLKYYKREWFVL